MSGLDVLDGTESPGRAATRWQLLPTPSVSNLSTQHCCCVDRCSASSGFRSARRAGTFAGCAGSDGAHRIEPAAGAKRREAGIDYQRLVVAAFRSSDVHISSLPVHVGARQAQSGLAFVRFVDCGCVAGTRPYATRGSHWPKQSRRANVAEQRCVERSNYISHVSSQKT